MSWQLIWEVVLAVAVTGFAVMAVVVTVGGFRDLRALMRRLKP